MSTDDIHPHSPHATLATGFDSSRRAQTATPFSQQVLDSMRNPNLPSASLTVRFGMPSLEPTQMTKIPASAQKVHEPVERRFESPDRVLPPGDQSHVVLAAGRAADSGGCHTQVAAAMQLQKHLGAIGARHDHAM
jgi:hypothetical protein